MIYSAVFLLSVRLAKSSAKAKQFNFMFDFLYPSLGFSPRLYYNEIRFVCFSTGCIHVNKHNVYQISIINVK